MNARSTKIHWSKRVPPHKIRRLYESDARGMLDQELLDDVGYGIYVRCRDIVEVSEAARGRVKCRNCGNKIVRQKGKRVGALLVGGEMEVLKCTKCSWQVTWGDYFKSYRGKRLLGGGVVHVFEAFVEQWISARSPQEKMITVDNLIHEFHVFRNGFGRPVGINVIQGKARDVIELIECLAYGPESTPGLQETRKEWRSKFEDNVCFPAEEFLRAGE